MVTSKGLTHNYSHVQGAPTHTYFIIPTYFWPCCKGQNVLHCFLADILKTPIYCLYTLFEVDPEAPLPSFFISPNYISRSVCWKVTTITSTFLQASDVGTHSCHVEHLFDRRGIWQDVSCLGRRRPLFSPPLLNPFGHSSSYTSYSLFVALTGIETDVEKYTDVLHLCVISTYTLIPMHDTII